MKKTHFLFAVLTCCCAAVFALLAHGAQAGASRDQVARGEYLVSFSGCDDCHTPKRFTDKGPAPDLNRRFSGTPAGTRVPAVPKGVIGPNGWGALSSNDMTVWAGPWGVSFASNLTPDKGTGMGGWTEASFVKSMRTGKHKGALRDILPPMPWQTIGKLNDADLKAVYAYLQTLKPIVNKVPDPIPPSR